MKNSDVVYRSRAVVERYNDSIVWQDSVLCSQIGITLKSTKPIQYTKKLPNAVTYSVFPNPTRGLTTIWISQIPSNPITFVATDILGREVYRHTESMQSNTHILDTKSWIHGIYHLRLIDGEKEIYTTSIQVTK